MFFRKKKAGERRYLQIVANEWRDGRSQQRLIASLGNLDELVTSGELRRLLASGLKLLNPGDSQPADTVSSSLVVEQTWREVGHMNLLESLLADSASPAETSRVLLQCAVRLAVGLPAAPENPQVAALHRVSGIEVADARRSIAALAALGQASEAARTFGVPAPERLAPGPRVWADGEVAPDTHETLYLVRESWPRGSGRDGEIIAGLIVDALARPVRIAIASGSQPGDVSAMLERARATLPLRLVYSAVPLSADEAQALGAASASAAPSWVRLDSEPDDNIQTGLHLGGKLRLSASPDLSEPEARRHAFHLLAGQASLPRAAWIDGWMPNLGGSVDPASVAIGDLVCRLLLMISAAALQHRMARALGRRLSIAETRSAVQRIEGPIETLAEDPVLEALLGSLGVVEADTT